MKNNKYKVEIITNFLDEEMLKLPDNDRTVLVWINNTENPQWSGYKLGAYLNEKWYCNEGRKSHEVVTDWSEIPVKK